MTEQESRVMKAAKALWPRRNKAVRLPQDKAIKPSENKDAK